MGRRQKRIGHRLNPTYHGYLVVYDPTDHGCLVVHDPTDHGYLVVHTIRALTF